MRGSWAGVLAAVVVLVGCKDNPGFAFAPDGPQDTGTSVADTGTSSPPDVTSSVDPGTTDGPVEPTSTTTTTLDPPLTTSTTSTSEPPVTCGDGVLDEGEDCDDGNQNPTDVCSNKCRTPLVPDYHGKFESVTPCLSIEAGPVVKPNAPNDLVLVRNDSSHPVFESIGGGQFQFKEREFSTGQFPPNVGVLAGLDPDKGRHDFIAISSTLLVCRNVNGTPCASNEVEPYPVPDDLMSDYMFYTAGLLLSADIDSDGIAEQLALLDGKAIAVVTNGDGNQVEAFALPGAITNVQSLAVGDIDGDEELDLAIGFKDGVDGKVQVFFDFDTAHFGEMNGGESVSQLFPVGQSAASIAVDRSFVFVADPGNYGLQILHGDTAEDLELRPETLELGPQESKLHVAHLSGPQPDVVILDTGDNSLRLASIRDGLPLTATAYTAGELAALRDAAIADLDGDGDEDIALVDTKCSVQIFLNQDAP